MQRIKEYNELVKERQARIKRDFFSMSRQKATRQTVTRNQRQQRNRQPVFWPERIRFGIVFLALCIVVVVLFRLNMAG